MNIDDVIRSTAKHIRDVGHNLREIINQLLIRSVDHDRTKWSEEEWPIFAEYTPKLASIKYGSDEYKECLKSIGPALQHHYSVNSHHAEYYPNKTIAEMTLLDMLEMLADWKAAQLRHNPPGSFDKSFEVNIPRYKISPELEVILRNTIKELGW